MTIIGGVTIGDNAVIAAGSVVIRDIPADSLAAGNPARVIRRISAEDRAKYPWAEQDRPAGLPKGNPFPIHKTGKK